MSQKIEQKKLQTISSLYVLNHFKYFQIYILGHLPQQNPAIKIFWIISSLHVWFSITKRIDIHKNV